MNKRALKVLEYDKILDKLASHTVSEIGRSLAQELHPLTERGSVKTLLEQTAQAVRFFARAGGQSPIDSFEDIRMTLKRTHVALSLSARELLMAARCLKVSRVARERLTSQDEVFSLLTHMASQLVSQRFLEDDIARCILNEEEIADNASVTLADIRRKMRIAGDRIRDKLNSMIKSTSMQTHLQEAIITIRNGRYVLPVKQESRGSVPGLVHDQSGSGATLFIEPMAVVELGNEIKKLKALEEEEIARILAALTAELEPYADDICTSLGLLGELDLIFAKAQLALQMRASCPSVSMDNHVNIKGGRHPLINADVVVPIDVWIGEEGISTLIITGPNTGGKTVTLKTLGLFSLMTQSGMFIPAKEGSVSCVFSEILADIGDEQSIEQSLSTFSGHMTNIVDILKSAGKNSLVLLDELGAGTDPVEGAALAMSILETLHKRGAMTAATTHYSEIKAFALTMDGMQNASMQFDVDRLCPTYRLFIGIPGKSNAFAICERLGLEKELIALAQSYLDKEDVAFEDVIESAQSEQKRAEEEREKAEQMRYELQRLKTEAETQKKRLEEERSVYRQKAREEARQLVRESREEMERHILGLKNLKGIDMSAVDRAIQEARDAARKRENSLADPLSKPAHDASLAPKKVLPGERVYLVDFGQEATVLKAANAKGEVLVQAGIMKMTVNISKMKKVEEKKKEKKGQAQVHIATAGETVRHEIDIRGKMVDEAIVEIDRYLSDAIMRGLSEVSIIHGKGTGALRKGVQEHLKRHPHVKNYRLGAYGEGDAGVTVVTLK